MRPRYSRNTYRAKIFSKGPGTLAELTRRGTRHYMTNNFKNEDLSHPSFRLELVLDILARRRKQTVDEESTKLGKLKDEIQENIDRLKKKEAKIAELKYKDDKIEKKLYVEVGRLMDVIQYLEDKVQRQADVLRDYEREFDGYKITFEERFKEFEDQKRKEAESSNAAAGEKVLEA